MIDGDTPLMVSSFDPVPVVADPVPVVADPVAVLDDPVAEVPAFAAVFNLTSPLAVLQWVAAETLALVLLSMLELPEGDDGWFIDGELPGDGLEEDCAAAGNTLAPAKAAATIRVLSNIGRSLGCAPRANAQVRPRFRLAVKDIEPLPTRRVPDV
jgi:hypothetical protein